MVLTSRNSIYPQMQRLTLPLTPTTFALVAGALASNYQINIANIPNFSSFAAAYGQYVLEGVRLYVRVDNGLGADVNTGTTLGYMDELAPAVAPTLAIAQLSPHLTIPNTPMTTPKPFTFLWKVQNLLDRQWSATSASYTPAALKLFASAGTGTGNTTVTQLSVDGSVAVAFRALSV
jgi:hypothetical protein